MNDTSTIHDQQAFAVIEEYRKAVQDGATDKAARIKDANPDLKADFHAIDKVVG